MIIHVEEVFIIFFSPKCSLPNGAPGDNKVSRTLLRFAPVFFVNLTRVTGNLLINSQKTFLHVINVFLAHWNIGWLVIQKIYLPGRFHHLGFVRVELVEVPRLGGGGATLG